MKVFDVFQSIPKNFIFGRSGKEFLLSGEILKCLRKKTGVLRGGLTKRGVRIFAGFVENDLKNPLRSALRRLPRVLNAL